MILTSVFKFDSFKWEKMHEHIWIVCFVSVKLSALEKVWNRSDVFVSKQKTNQGFYLLFQSWWTWTVLERERDKNPPNEVCERPN